MLRPARLLERLASPRRELTPPTGPPVYGRACPSLGLPQPESAITTRPNHPLPRQVLHLQACQSPKAAHRNLLFAPPLVLSAARVMPAVVTEQSVADSARCPFVGSAPKSAKAKAQTLISRWVLIISFSLFHFPFVSGVGTGCSMSFDRSATGGSGWCR